MEYSKYSLLSFTIFFDLEEIIFEIFNISENNIISVELAKVLGYVTHCQFQNDEVVAQWKQRKALNSHV